MLRTLFFSYYQITNEEGIPSKRLVNIYDFCEQIRTFLYRSLSVSLRATDSSIFLTILQREPVVLMLYLFVRLYCFKLYILVILFVTLTIIFNNKIVKYNC